MLVIPFHAYGIFKAEHVGQVPHLHVGRLDNEEAETGGGGIVADALNGEVQRSVTLSFYLQSLNRASKYFLFFSMEPMS